MSTTILDICLKTRVGSPVPEGNVKLLRDECAKSDSYRTLASRLDYKVETRKLSIGGRKRKYVCFVKGEKAIPVTKNKLYVKEKRPCKACGRINCQKKAVVKAFRDAIQPQIEEHKEKRASQIQSLIGDTTAGSQGVLNSLCRCAITGTPLNLCIGGSHVDHVFPFKELLADFCLGEGLSLCDIKLSGRGQNKMIKDEEVLEAWQDYHREKAVLQIVCAKANIKKGAKH